MLNTHASVITGAQYRALRASLTLSSVLSTGIAALDRWLPGGGWPIGGVVELVAAREGVDPIELLLPALATLSWEDRWICWIAPPALPDAAELSARGFSLSRLLLIHRAPGQAPLAIAERGLNAGSCAALLAWPDSVSAAALHRLRAAAEAAAAIVFLLRPATALAEPAWSTLRLALGTSVAGGLVLERLPSAGITDSALALSA